MGGLAAFCAWLAETSFSQAIQTNSWVIPSVQTIHILAIAVVFSSAILIDLRLWRIVDHETPMTAVARRFLSALWPGLLVLLLSGALLIIGEPKRSLQNSSFYIKMSLLAAAIVLTAILQWTIRSNPDFWDGTSARRAVGKLVATLSILIWCGIIFAGRWIAYTQPG